MVRSKTKIQQQKLDEQRNQNWATLAEPNIIVSEATRIKISKILDEFSQSDEDVYTFEVGLLSSERALVHFLCRKKGMRSKSYGNGIDRCVSVYKREKKSQDDKQNENDTCLSFSQETKEVLRDLFTHYPPSVGEQDEEMVRDHVGENNKRPRREEDSFCKPSMNKAEIARNVEALTSRLNSPNLRQITEQRSKLPIASFKDVIMSSIDNNQVVLVSGETGCGKTTQVPQYLLDYMWGKGEGCKVVCTQPRRISAISVAERISYERGEKVGDSVGYKIRLEAKGGKQSSIMFCTNGILLRVLVGKGITKSNTGSDIKTSKKGDLEVTHIIVDEIHERDHFSDFILAILRDALPSYPHLRVILMSATIDAERFSQYFGGCPIIRVPGFTYPVKSFYLEDILPKLKSVESNHLNSASQNAIVQDTELTDDYTASLDEAIHLAMSSDEFDPLLDLISSVATPKICNYQHSLTGASPLMAFAGKGRVSDVCMLLSLGADCNLRAKDGKTAMDWAQQENQGEVVEIINRHLGSSISESERQELLEKYLATINPENIDIILIEHLLMKICTDSDEGAILLFLPGWDDINRIREKLLSSTFFSNTSKFVIISLHSMVPSGEQKKVFMRPPHGSRKIILSTNIAETAVTIDDVVYVIDSGRMKEKSYDPYSNVSTLHSSWVSKASAKQREGRAGRCQAGVCYHLYSKTRATSLPDYQDPEIKRMPIEELCLQVKLLDRNCRIVDFLQKTLDPPVSETIRNAILVLQEIGALTLDEDLTELGEKLGSLPVHPSTSKMLFVAILMNCLDPALTLACACDNRDPFILPMAPQEKKKALSAKAGFASLYGGHSDQLVLIAAYECWERAKGRGQEARFCSNNFISPSAMKMLSRMRKQLQKELIRNGFVQEDVSHCSLNVRDPGILHAVLVAGLYPMVGQMLPPRGGLRCVVETTTGPKVRLHPRSSNFRLSIEKSSSRPLVVYDEIIRGDGGMYIRSCSIVGPYPLLMLAKEMVVAPAKDGENKSDEEIYASGSDEDEMKRHAAPSGKHERLMSHPDNKVSVVIDRWLTFQSTALDVAQIYCLRERLNEAILFKVKNPNKVLPPSLEASLYAIACIFSYDGLQGIPPSFESIGSDTLLMDAAGNGRENETSISCSDSNKFLRSLKSDDASHSYHYNQPRQVPRNLHPNVTTNPNMKRPYMHPNASTNTNFQQPCSPVGQNPYQSSELWQPPCMQTDGHPSQTTQLQGSGSRGYGLGRYSRHNSSKRGRDTGAYGRKRGRGRERAAGASGRKRGRGAGANGL